MDLGLSGRVALITGPAKGMGPAITRAFAGEGCRIALFARGVDALEAQARVLRAAGSDVVVAAGDVTDADACVVAVAKVVDAFGSVDVLLNIHGGTGPIGKTGAETTPAEFDEIVDVNLNGCFHMMRACAPVMMARRYGKIVNLGGTFGLRGRAGRVGYSASKWGLRGLTKSFALELGPYNINVNTVAPGMVDGPRFRDKVCADLARRLGISLEEAMQRHADDYALKRVSQDTDVANACLFLASDASRQITGTDLPVDGGWAVL